MANEKRLIDANALLLEIEEELQYESPRFTAEQNKLIDMGLRIAAKDIRHRPTVDAVEVVRCKKCQHWNKRYETKGICLKHNSILTFTSPDFYCACGERESDGICKED